VNRLPYRTSCLACLIWALLAPLAMGAGDLPTGEWLCYVEFPDGERDQGTLLVEKESSTYKDSSLLGSPVRGIHLVDGNILAFTWGEEANRLGCRLEPGKDLKFEGPCNLGDGQNGAEGKTMATLTLFPPRKDEPSDGSTGSNPPTPDDPNADGYSEDAPGRR
jgi:hypothetical protein